MKNIMRSVLVISGVSLWAGSQSAYADCDTQATVASHVAAGRAYSQSCGQSTCYYATGSNDSLGSNSSSSTVLAETASGYYEHAGLTGNYTNDDGAIVSVPISYAYCGSSQTYPVIVALHGWLGNPSGLVGLLPLPDYTDSHEFITIFPPVPGSGFFNGWHSRPTSDVEAQINWIEDRYRVDADRIYIAGHSAGAKGAYKFSVQSSGRAAGLLISAGNDDQVSGQTPNDATAVIAFHSRADRLVSHSSGEATIENFADAQNCDPSTTLTNSYTTTDGNDVDTQTWEGCDDGMNLTLHHVDNAAHNGVQLGSDFWSAALTQLLQYSR